MIGWTEGAVQQLDWAREYITVTNSDEIARRVVDRILSSVEQLARFSMLGSGAYFRHTRTGNSENAVRLLRAPCRRPELATYHGAQRWAREL